MLNAPKKVTWCISIILAVIGLIFVFVLPKYAVWPALASAVLSILSVKIKGL